MHININDRSIFVVLILRKVQSRDQIKKESIYLEHLTFIISMICSTFRREKEKTFFLFLIRGLRE